MKYWEFQLTFYTEPVTPVRILNDVEIKCGCTVMMLGELFGKGF